MMAAAGEPTSTSSISEQPPEQRPRSGGASWSSGAAAELQPSLWHPDAAGASNPHSKAEAGHALSGALAQHLHQCTAPAEEPRARGSGAALLRGSFSAFAEANRHAEQAESDRMRGRRHRRSAFGSRGRDCSDDELAVSMEPYTPSYSRKSKSMVRCHDLTPYLLSFPLLVFHLARHRDGMKKGSCYLPYCHAEGTPLLTAPTATRCNSTYSALCREVCLLMWPTHK